MIGHCQMYTFGHVGKGKATGKQVDVQFKCVPVRPGQLVFVTLKTIPNYCKAMWTQRHLVPECSHEGIRDEITECITGKLVFTVDKARNMLTVKVTDAPENTDYNLRLCHKRNVICAGEGAHRTIKPQYLDSSITLHYSKPLPCLCIEGWPARVDAPRVQVCPFKNNLEELWSGITYDLNKEELIWEPLCPVKVSVSLCHADGGKSCQDLGNVFHSEGQKVCSVVPFYYMCRNSSALPVIQLCILSCTSWCRVPERSQDIEKILLPALIILTVILVAVLFGRMTIKGKPTVV
uniref:Putative interleukin-17 receptor E-like n=1 Tax=Sinocyclocheilus grahami TaxID=75366 RepID=A0A672RVQ2_SINGR